MRIPCNHAQTQNLVPTGRRKVAEIGTAAGIECLVSARISYGTVFASVQLIARGYAQGWSNENSLALLITEQKTGLLLLGRRIPDLIRLAWQMMFRKAILNLSLATS